MDQNSETETAKCRGRVSLEKLEWMPGSHPKLGLSDPDDSGEESSDGNVESRSTTRDQLKEITASDDGSVASREADETNNADEGSASSTRIEEESLPLGVASEASGKVLLGKCVENVAAEKRMSSADTNVNGTRTQTTAERDATLPKASSGTRKRKSVMVDGDIDPTKQPREMYVTRDRIDRRSKVEMTSNSVHILENENEPINMYLVPHLSEEGVKDGLFFQRITVHTPSDDTALYEFEVNVKPSKVGKNARMGCFLTFRGARVLKAVRWKANQKKYDERVIVDPGTLEDLEVWIWNSSQAHR